MSLLNPLGKVFFHPVVPKSKDSTLILIISYINFLVRMLWPVISLNIVTASNPTVELLLVMLFFQTLTDIQLPSSQLYDTVDLPPDSAPYVNLAAKLLQLWQQCFDIQVEDKKKLLPFVGK